MATTNLRDTYGTIDMELKKYKLGELADFYGGVAYKPSDITNEGIRIIRGGNIQNGVILEKADDVFLPLSYANPENQIHIYDTIIVSSTGSIDALAKAATCFEEMPGTQIGAFLRIIRPKDKKNAMLISAWCTSQHFRDYMINCAKGTSINNIRTDFLENYELVVPSDENVRGLSSLYLNIERKLYLNRHINQNLEALAKQLYDYWFVQFDFPDEQGLPYRTSGGLMKYEPKLKKEIPIDWHCGNLFEIANFTNGLACQNHRPKEGEQPLPVIKIREMRDGFTNDTEFVTPNIPENVKVYNGDVLFSWSASLEVMLWAFGDGGLNQHIFKVTPAKGFPKSFYYYQLLNYVDVFKHIADARKTTMGHITQDHLQQSTIAIPDDVEIANKLEKRIAPIFEAIINNQVEISDLIKQRDELLPLLMNGQVNFDLSAC